MVLTFRALTNKSNVGERTGIRIFQATVEVQLKNYAPDTVGELLVLIVMETIACPGREQWTCVIHPKHRATSKELCKVFAAKLQAAFSLAGFLDLYGFR